MVVAVVTRAAMKGRWKSWFLALTWLLLSMGTSILVVLTQVRVSPALESVPSMGGEVGMESSSPSDLSDLKTASHEGLYTTKSENNSSFPLPTPHSPPPIYKQGKNPNISTGNAEVTVNHQFPTPLVVSEDIQIKTEPTTDNQATEAKNPENKPSETKEPENPETSVSGSQEEGNPLTPEEIARREQFIAADKLFLAGNVAEAEKIYRQLKEPFANTTATVENRQPAITDPEQLPPRGRVYWREAEAGMAAKLQTRVLIPLKLLVEEVPEFIPGYIRYAQALREYGQEKEALRILEQGTTRYPQQPELVKARVEALASAKKYMEASLAARQYAILYPQDPLAPEFIQLADDNLRRYKSHIRREIRGNAIANIITGAIGYAVTGSLLGPFSALDSTLLLLQGEESIGESVAKQAQRQLNLVKDETVVNYVNEIGQKLAQVAGRKEFKYEFFVLPEPELNAFALPGGKIFINAGAIDKANSEAELAGLIGHELAHVVLSHGFQLVTQGNLISNLTQYLPLGGTVGQLFSLSYSRDMERQADVLGTRLIVASGYAADGLRNLMATLEKEQKNTPPEWASSHPGGRDRVKYLEAMIVENGYNRYGYEGVKKHIEVQTKVKEIIKQTKACRKDRKKCPKKERE
ncbi:M48 family metalloprotease [Calothrix sp. NIES-3974]|uniref:M48 family metallopeptidase n=1 Tax=Calothrix sp. NIES-3974 TaxID=2005462 RepID=UPI003FA45637